MAISGNCRVSTITGSSFSHPFRSCIASKKAEFSSFLHSKTCANVIRFEWRNVTLDGHFTRDIRKRRQGKQSLNSIIEETEKFLMSVVNMSFLDRLSVAWRIVFPSSSSSEKSSNAMVAKKRLKMILFSDRCVVTEEAKRKIVDRIVRVLSEFVEIESQDQVQLNVSTGSDIGTIYSVIVPVRRVKPEHHEWEELGGGFRNIRYKDTEERSGFVDLRFEI